MQLSVQREEETPCCSTIRRKRIRGARSPHSCTAVALAQAPVEVSFFYPVAVGGPITKIIDSYAADFEKENPGIKIKPIYSGTYQDSITKALTAVKSGEPPVTSILLSTDMYTLIDEDAIVPFDDLIKTRRGPRLAQELLSRRSWRTARPAARRGASRSSARRSSCTTTRRCSRRRGSTRTGRRRTGRSRLEYAQKLTKRDASGKVTQWGVQIPSSGFPYWLFQALAIQNGVNLMNPRGHRDLLRPAGGDRGAAATGSTSCKKHKVHPEGIVEWGTTPKDFFEKKMAMMWTTTGNLTNVKNNAKFDFGVAMLPAGKQRGSPTGGGNFYLFKKTTPAQREAAFKFIKWITTPQRAAQWGIDTGYVAVRADALETPVMKKYVAGFPRRPSRATSCRIAKAELSTHDNQRVTKALNDGLQAALTGTKTPEQAMKDAQREAERLLRSYK